MIDELVKSQKVRVAVIPANPRIGSGAGAGIQLFQILKNSLDSGFRWSDAFLRDHPGSFAETLRIFPFIITLRTRERTGD